MASIEKRVRNGKISWRAMYREPDGTQRSRSFPRRVDAERFLTTVEHSKMVGSYLDPSLARVTVGQWAGQWLAGKANLKSTTAERYAGILREHIEPRWGTVKLADVSHAAVQAWISDLATRVSPATVRKVHQVFGQILGLAVKDGRLARNPAAAVDLPRVVVTERRYLSHHRVRDLASHCGQQGLTVLFLAYTGVRFGEMAALRVGRLDLLRRRAIIAESVTEVHGAQVWSTPKGHERREVPIPRSWSTSWPSTSPARARPTSCSPHREVRRCGRECSAGTCWTGRPSRSAWTGWTLTSCATPRPPWPSPPAPT